MLVSKTRMRIAVHSDGDRGGCQAESAPQPLGGVSAGNASLNQSVFRAAPVLPCRRGPEYLSTEFALRSLIEWLWGE
jgi:hypothetical protein